MKTLPDGAKEREGMGSEFWKPKKADEQLWGKIASFDTGGKFGPSIVLHPCVTFSAKGKGEAFHSISLGLNAVLRKRIVADNVGDFVAIKFTGVQETDKGKMKLYEVYEIKADHLKTELDELGYSETEDADLPF